MTLRILAIDPGPQQSGYCLFDGTVISSGVLPNQDLLAIVKDDESDALAIEKFVNYGRAVGDEVYDACNWGGRFQQAWGCPDEVFSVSRPQVKKAIGLPSSADDAKVNARMRQILGEKGTKAAPGPTHGVSTHAWAALAVAYTVFKRHAQ